MLPDRIVAGLELLLQESKLHLPLGTRTTVWFECRLDCPDILHVEAEGLLGVVDGCQPPVDVAR